MFSSNKEQNFLHLHSILKIKNPWHSGHSTLNFAYKLWYFFIIPIIAILIDNPNQAVTSYDEYSYVIKLYIHEMYMDVFDFISFCNIAFLSPPPFFFSLEKCKQSLFYI